MILTVILATLLSTLRSIKLPQCQTSAFYSTLPLTLHESEILNLDSIFGGYNLDYSIQADPNILKYLTLGSKMRKLKQEFPDIPLSGLKSYHLQKIGNGWGQRFVALGEKENRTLVHYGILSNNQSVPVINNVIKVENLTNLTCFDAVLFPLQNLIIVDCAQSRPRPDAKGLAYQNIFYYYYINNGSEAQKLKTEIYVPFELIKQRKLDIYSDLQSRHTFLLRTYIADGMVNNTMDNTYTEIFMIEDPRSPWIVGVLDRTFLKVPKLRIMDVKIYLGEIYILDYLKGIHRVYISTSEDLEYQGTYEARGFKKFSVYSPNLDNHLELALSNEHAIHEIDWTYIDQPRLLNKYSLMPNSIVSQVFLNERFIFLQSSSTDENNIAYNYTWIFNRGDRTFARAFKVFNHSSSNTFIDLNEDSTYLIIMDDLSISNYAFDQANLVLQISEDDDLLDVISNFTITATSYDPNSPTNATCQLQVNFTLLNENNRTMWPIGEAPPSFYNANYPGKVRIELQEYVIGPNVSYKIQETEKGQLKKAKVYQQEQLNVSWINPPPFENITFLQTETIHGKLKDTLVIYMQDNSNLTYISYCIPDHQEIQVVCNETETKDLGGKVNNWATTFIDSVYTKQTHHLLAYTTLQYYNTIFLRDLGKRKDITSVIPGRSFAGNISSLSITGKYMYAVLRHIKRINVYLLDECLDDNCESICSINHLNLYKLGLRYFAPMAVHSSRFHPDVLFIKTSDSIIALDLSKECVPKLLTVIRPVNNSLTDFIFEVNANFLIVTIAPDIVREYDLSRLSLRQVTLTKKYPLYGYKLPKNYDFDISDYGNCVYISTLSEGGDYNIFVYRSGYPAVGSLYNQIDLFVYQNLLIDASGYIVDYVTVVSGKQLRIFRQYQFPQAEIENPNQNYTFYLEYYNSLDHAKLELVSVQIINLPTYIKVNPFLSDIMNTKDLLYSGENRLNELSDEDWYQGNVLYIRPSCRDCGDKVRINNHIQPQSTVTIIPNLTDYEYNTRGGTAQAAGGVVTFRRNGTIAQIVTFQQSDKKNCLLVATNEGERFEVSACIGEQAIYLYVVSLSGTKPFAFPAYETDANNLFKLEAVNGIVMLVDIQSNPYKKSTRGGIYLFQIDSNWELDQPLTQLQFIEGEDFGMRELGNLYFNNAELTYNSKSGTYRLYITEMTKGLFMVEFKHETGRSDIIIQQISYINLRSMLSDLKQTLPYDATYQAVSLISSALSGNITTDTLLVTTGRYNTLQLTIRYNFSSIISKTITRFYLRYSYYEVTNHIAHVNGLFLVKHVLPDQYNMGNQTQQLYTVYSTKGDYNGTIERRGLIGAMPLKDNRSHSFDFNLTFNPYDQHSEPRVEVIIVQEMDGQLIKASLHRNLSLVTTELLDTQIIYIDLVNDFNIEKIRILLNGLAPFPQWKLITIILFSIIGGLLLLGGAAFGIKRWREGKGTMGEERDSLLTEATYN